MTDAAKLAVDLMKQVAKLLDKLSEDQLTALATGGAELAFVSPEATVRAGTRRAAASRPRQPKAPRPSIGEAASRLSQLTTRDEAVEYLATSGLRAEDLKAVAKELGVTVRGRKDEITRQLAEGAVGFRTKLETVMGGPYHR
jgi:hypothetical protein